MSDEKDAIIRVLIKIIDDKKLLALDLESFHVIHNAIELKEMETFCDQRFEEYKLWLKGDETRCNTKSGR